MKTTSSIPTPHRTPSGSFLCLCLLGLVAGLSTAVLAQAVYTAPYTFTTFAGNPGYGSTDGTNSDARFAFPDTVAVDGAGNAYVADTVNSTIRRMTPVGTNWVVTTLAGLAGSPGSADGTNSAARFNNPDGVAVDDAGTVYAADSGNHTIRKLTPIGTNWVVTTLAGLAESSGYVNGMNGAARFNSPHALAVDSAGIVYVADSYNNAIRKVTPTGAVTTLAGGFDYPCGVAVDSATNVYVADTDNCIIRKVAPGGGVTTLAGLAGSIGAIDGNGSAARFYYPYGVAVDSATNIYVADSANNVIRKVARSGAAWVVTTLAGLPGSLGSADGANAAARFNFPLGVAVDTAGNLYVADSGNSTLRGATPAGTNWLVTTLVGRATGGAGSADGMGRAALFNYPFGVTMDGANNLFVADFYNNTIRKVSPAGLVTTVAGQAGIAGNLNGIGTNALFNSPDAVATDSMGNLYVADYGGNTIRKVTPTGTNWVVSTLAGGLGSPYGVAVDTNGNVYVAEYANNRIVKMTATGEMVHGQAGFNQPTDVALDTAGNLYVADYGNHTIRKVTTSGTNWVVSTLAGLTGVLGSADGTNSAARFNYPARVTVDSVGNVYVADNGNNTIRKMTPIGTNWVVTTLAGLAGTFGATDGTGSAARFWNPGGIAIDGEGNLYVADNGNSTIRKGFPASSVPPPVLQSPSLINGHHGFGITGLPNLAVDIQCTDDLSQWELLGTYILEGGTNYIVNPNPAPGNQFYRGHVR